MNPRLRKRLTAAISLVAAAPLIASAARADGSTVFALTQGNGLARFRPATPSKVLSLTFITGLAAGDKLVGIDFRPDTGELYGLSSQSRVYIIDASTGAATQLGVPLSTPLAGTQFGVDFNPVPDRIRVTSDTEQNLRLNPATGAIAAVDPLLAYASGDPGFGSDPSVTACAYTNSFAGATGTSLYCIDTAADALVLQGSLGSAPISPNTGQLFTVGKLGVDVISVAGFDIGQLGGAVAVFTPAGTATARFYNINLTTGAATDLGPIGFNVRVQDIAVAPVSTARIVGLGASGRLVTFAPGRPGVMLSSVQVTGLQTGETLLGIDFRPSTGDLIGLGDSSRVYVLNRASGAATAIGTVPFTPGLNGTKFGVDFNPTPDRIRVVSEADQNLRLNPVTGAVAAVDTPIAYAAGDANVGADPRLVASAYTMNVPGTTVTTLYGIDSGLDILVTQGSLGSAPVSPNSGQLFTVGPLGMNTTDDVGFDVSTLGGVFASLTAPAATESQLFTINLATGATSARGTISVGEVMRDIAVAPASRRPLMFGVDLQEQLVSFTPGAPGTLISSVPVTGLAPGDSIVGIDFRPGTGELFAQGKSNQVYTLSTLTGKATPLGTPNFVLSGLAFALDFNPVPDRIRLASDTEQNLRLNPSTGLLASSDPPLAYASGDPNFGADPAVMGCAYTNSSFGVFNTTLYDIDATLDVLVTQGSLGSAPISPNTGQLFTIGKLGVDIDTVGGFDIAPFGGAFAALRAPGAPTSQLFSLNLGTGVATLLGSIGGSSAIRALAIAPPGI